MLTTTATTIITSLTPQEKLEKNLCDVKSYHWNQS